jgi:hypothetical protein
MGAARRSLVWLRAALERALDAAIATAPACSCVAELVFLYATRDEAAVALIPVD